MNLLLILRCEFTNKLWVSLTQSVKHFMKQTKTALYFVPGLAAGPEIFEQIKLPEDDFMVVILEWLIPNKKESLKAYAKRMAARVNADNAVLIGVSFGGIMVQEMKAFLPKAKVIIVSSVKSKHELPKRFILARKSLLYKLVPTSLVLSAKDLTRFAIGPKTKKRLELYNTYLSVRDKTYLDWAIKEMVCWDREDPDPQIHHIHGDKDIVFPIENISKCTVIPSGTHVMILYKAKAVSQALISHLKES